MVINRTAIHFIVYNEDEKYELQTYEGEYRNLMVLLTDKIYLEDFGQCKGMGRCGTCAVKIEGLSVKLNTLDRNEESTLYKMGITDPGIRLACQVLVDESLEDGIVNVIGAESVEYL
ncbi:MAG: 2Fe-2S iron-sulfur cluster-binding protein [Ferruginibacter sp.]